MLTRPPRPRQEMKSVTQYSVVISFSWHLCYQCQCRVVSEPWCQYCISAKTRDTKHSQHTGGCPQIISYKIDYLIEFLKNYLFNQIEIFILAYLSEKLRLWESFVYKLDVCQCCVHISLSKIFTNVICEWPLPIFVILLLDGLSGITNKDPGPSQLRLLANLIIIRFRIIFTELRITTPGAEGMKDSNLTQLWVSCCLEDIFVHLQFVHSTTSLITNQIHTYLDNQMHILYSQWPRPNKQTSPK